MKKSLYLIFTVLILTFILASCTLNKVNENKNSDNSSSVVIEENTKTVSGKVILTYSDDLDKENLLSVLGVTKYTDLKGMKKLIIDTELEAKKVLSVINYDGIKGIVKVEPNYLFEVDAEIPETEVQAEELSQVRALSDNPLYYYQWALNNEKDANGNLIPGHFDAENVWKLSTGKDVKVAVIDTGVDGGHPDLSANMIAAWDTVNATTIADPKNAIGYGTHGSHVAGIIASVDNNTGVVGLAKDAKIMAIPFLSVPEGVTYAQLAVAVEWAVENGAKILQNSWGGPGYRQVLKDIFDYAMENNVSVVVSTGNTHIDENWGFPNTIPGIIGVGASDVHGQLASFSSRGDSVSVTAPGVKILSTIARSTVDGPTTDYDFGSTNEPYQFMNGTSMASPYVSAVAALLYEKYPNATPYQIRKVMEITASNNGAWNVDTGYGVVNPIAALSATLPTETGANFTVKVKDSFGEAVPAAYVSLKRSNGASYYAKTDSNGEAKFVQIDPATYDVIVGGPDYQDMTAPNSRMEEQRQATINNVSVADGETSRDVTFTSVFSATITKPQAAGDYTVKVLSALDGSEISSLPLAGSSLQITKPATKNFYIKLETTNEPTLPAAFVSDSFESGDFTSVATSTAEATISSWITGGDVSPVATTLLNGKGISAVFGGKPLGISNLTDDQTSRLALNVDLAASVNGYMFNFYYFASTEADYDFFRVYLDGEVKFETSGSAQGTTGISLTGGKHTIIFEYAKDPEVSSTYDVAAVDDVSITKIPDDKSDFDVPVVVNINGNTINFTNNLYYGNILDEFESKTVPWTVF